MSILIQKQINSDVYLRFYVREVCNYLVNLNRILYSSDKDGNGLDTIDEETPKAPEIKFKNLGADSHWERPQVAPAGSVIALPAAAPQDPQGETSPSSKVTGIINCCLR